MKKPTKKRPTEMVEIGRGTYIERPKRSYPYIMVIKHCECCGDRIPGRGGLYCWKDKCQAARKARKRANEKAWNQAHKPWRKRNYENSSKEAHPSDKPAKVKRYCKYPYCKQKKVPLPKGYYLYHPSCHQHLVDIVGRGIDTAEGKTL